MGAMFLLSRRGGGHWHGGSIGIWGGGGLCCPAHLNSCPTSTRTIKNPLPWKKKVMWKIRLWNQGAVLAQGGS